MEEANKKFLIIFIAIVAILALVFILRTVFSVMDNETGDENGSKKPSTDKFSAENLMKDLNDEEAESINNLPKDFLDQNYDLSLKLFKEILEDKNPVYSPVPVYLSLALISNGADSQAKEEILSVINEEDLSDLNIYYKKLIEDLTGKEGNTELNISNSIWYDKDFKANKVFLQTNKNYYNADAYSLDFEDERAPKVINDWVSEVTNEKINNMVDEIDDEVVMYLFSSIYFNADWKAPFPKEKTFNGEFFINDEPIEVQKMSNTSEFKHIISEDEKGVLLPYKDEKYRFLALMPKKDTDIREYIKKLSMEDISEKLNNLKDERVNIILPKFEVSFKNKLKDTLKDMGIKRIFSEEVNSLEGMGESAGNLYISDMTQKTYMRVDEKGTEAASVVEAQMEATSLTESIDFNRPFVYGVLDMDTRLPVFLGIMDNPNVK